MATQILSGVMIAVAEPVLPSRQEFMDRFPPAIRSMIFTHQVRDTTLGAAIREALMRYQIVSGVDPTDPRTIAPVEQLVDAAIMLGEWSAEDREAAIAQILA